MANALDNATLNQAIKVVSSVTPKGALIVTCIGKVNDRVQISLDSARGATFSAFATDSGWQIVRYGGRSPRFTRVHSATVA